MLEAPYRGLMPFEQEHAPYFFGRSAESKVIAANLLASPLTLLYGSSGVGKTSVLNAAVVPYLKELAAADAATGGPGMATVVFHSWKDKPVVDLIREIALQVPATRAAAGASFTEHLRAASRLAGGDLLIILDQFEEYFLYHPDEEAEGSFGDQLAAAINARDVRVNFLIAIREDSLAGLDRFKGKIPNLFANYLRIEHLDRAAARDAILCPLERFPGGYSVETEFVDTVLDQVRTGRVSIEEGVAGGVGAENDTRIETPYLELVLLRVWDREVALGSRHMRLSTLATLGGAEQIVRRELDAALDALEPHERDVSMRAFRYLVTPSRAKIALTARDLASFVESDLNVVRRLLGKLSSGTHRILSPVGPAAPQAEERYQIFHDVLGPSVLAWAQKYEVARQQSLAEQERKKVRRLWLLSGALGIVTVLALIASLMAQHYVRVAKAETQRATESALRALKGEADAKELQTKVKAAAKELEERNRDARMAAARASQLDAEKSAFALVSRRNEELLKREAETNAVAAAAAQKALEAALAATTDEKERAERLQRAADEAAAKADAAKRELESLRMAQTAGSAPVSQSSGHADLSQSANRFATEKEFLEASRRYARELGLTTPEPTTVFQRTNDPGLEASWNEKANRYEINPKAINSAGLVEYSALMGRFFAKNYSRCFKGNSPLADVAFWQDFRFGITGYIMSTEPHYAKSAVSSGGSRPTNTALALRNLEKAAGSADPVRRLAVALLEGYDCNWTRQSLKENATRINAQLQLVPESILRQAFNP